MAAEEVALIGLGRMGRGLCARLVSAGFEVHAHDAREEATCEGAQLGARPARSVPDAVARARFVVSSLPGPDEVAAVAGDVVAALAPGASWIEMSTAVPGTAAVLAGVPALDAPVGGGPPAAAEGRLLAFVGGSDEVLQRCRPVLDALCTRILPVGPLGSGYAVKLLVNALWFGQAVACAEALAVGERLGLDVEVARRALEVSAAGSSFVSGDLPRLLAGDPMADFGLAGCCSELDAVVGLGEQLGVALEVTGAVAGVYREALERFGPAGGELGGARLVAERAGVTLRRASTSGGSTPL